jgi:hypothetical protein
MESVTTDTRPERVCWMADNRPDRAADPGPPLRQGGDATATVTDPPAAVDPPPGTRGARTASEAGPAWFMRRTWPGVRGSWRQFMRFLANAAVMASVVIAVLFAAHITFVVFKANPAKRDRGVRQRLGLTACVEFQGFVRAA